MRHLLKYGEDRTNTNIDTAVKGHMLQNILPASKTPTFSSIKNLWLRFSIQAWYLYTYREMHHSGQFSEVKTSNNLDRATKGTSFKNVNLLQKP